MPKGSLFIISPHVGIHIKIDKKGFWKISLVGF